MRWRYRDTVLALCTLAFFVTMVGRLAISPVLPEIVETFSVSNAVVGLSLSGMWLAYGLAQYPSGVLADRYGERLVILVAVGGSALAALAVSIAPVFGLFFLSTILLGAVAGLHYSVATTLLARTYDNVGTAVGVHNSGATVAGLLTPVVVAWIAVRFGWRLAVAVIALVGIPSAVLFAWKVRPTEPRRPETPLRERFQLGPISELLSRPPIAFTLVIAIVGEFAWQGTASFLPTFLIEHRGLSTTLAGVFFSVYFVVQGVAQIGVGAVSDRIGRDRALAGCMLAGVVGFGLLVTAAGLPSIIIGVTLVGIAMSFGSALMPRFLRELSAEEQNAGFGLVRTVYMIVASLGSVVVGLLADLFGWTVAFGFLAASLAAIVLALAINSAFKLGY
ncbi:MFS transporter [Natronorubrum bangense]|uniref:Major facilitator superfamily protein n=2 Tax=Natronorubrum bangense TaxID=61858 RepID=L9WR06_9EURY|nr:MFS transporter [Natronorubrum bangense]ELY50758.1 major facilitator superfamily protein [Natronorubrum bangense JCM 10635]QCC54352.1 MFS transporter [Natronorubrum bangense]